MGAPATHTRNSQHRPANAHLRPVRIRVTGNIVDVGLVKPYDHTSRPTEIPIYRVPLYEVRVNERFIFKAIRFGYRGHFERPWDPHRKCDEGMVSQREVVAKWNGSYSPHSFGQGNGLQGGFLIRSDMVYIHEGPSKQGASGTLSCIEIASDHEADDWNRFLLTVGQQAGVSYVGTAVQRGKVLVTVEAAPFPVGLLVGKIFSRYDPVARSYQPAWDLLPNWVSTTVPWAG